MEYANRCLANIKYIKLNTGLRKQRQKVPDNEDIDMDKIVKDDMPRYAIKQDLKKVLYDRQIATETERQLKEKEAKRLALEKAKRLQTEKDTKEKEAKRLALEMAQIEALINKHKPRTPKTTDEVNTPSTGKNGNIDGKEGTKKVNPHTKKLQRLAKSKRLKTRVINPIKINQIHYQVIQ